MGDLREMCEVSLDVRFQDGVGSGVAERRAVLIQKIHQLFTQKPER